MVGFKGQKIYIPVFIYSAHLNGVVVSVLATGPKGRGFKHG
jgi:hypothetical protein